MKARVRMVGEALWYARGPRWTSNRDEAKVFHTKKMAQSVCLLVRQNRIRALVEPVDEEGEKR